MNKCLDNETRLSNELCCTQFSDTVSLPRKS